MASDFAGIIMPFKNPEKLKEWKQKHRDQIRQWDRAYSHTERRKAYLRAYMAKYRKTHPRKKLAKSPEISKVPKTLEVPSSRIQQCQELIENTPNPKNFETVNFDVLPRFVEIYSNRPTREQNPPHTWTQCENITHSDKVVCGLDPEKRRCQEIPWYTCRSLQGSRVEDFGK
jgi:hypothetical protein